MIPHVLWAQADLILVTYGDADHAEYVPQVARASGAPVVCRQGLARKWQRKWLNVIPVAPGETVEAAGVQVHGVLVRHGIKLNVAGLGTVGLLFTLNGCRLLNLGNAVLLEDAWRGLRPDVLMVPIGRMMTMDVDDALRSATNRWGEV